VHNGEIGCWKALKKQVVHMLSQDSFSLIEGSTDSEYIFALFLDQYKKYTGDTNALVKATQDTINLIEELVKPFDNQKGETTLNLGITDGTQVICTRFSTGNKHLSLYYCPSLVFQEDLNQWQQDRTVNYSSGTVVASEPLNLNRSEWSEVPKNHLLHIGKGADCNLIPL
jgi:glutamine amidotransferase